MEDSLVLRFIGLDMLTNVASQVGMSVDRLARRIEQLGSSSSRGYGASGAAAIAMKQQVTQAAADITIAESRAEQATAMALYNVTAARGSAATMAARRGLAEATASEAVVVAQQKEARAVLSGKRAQIQAMEQTSNAASAHASAMISSMTRVGSVMALVGVGFLAAGGIMAAGLGEAVKQAANYQSQMTLIETQAGAQAGEIKKVSKGVLDIGAALGVTAEESAKAMYHVESLGFRGDLAMEILKAGLTGANVGLADMETTTNALGTVMASHITGVKNAMDAMAQLDAIVGVGNMRMDDLNAAFRSGIIGSAQLFGVSLKGVGAALATLTDLGMPAAQAGTRLRMSLSLLGAPSQAAAKWLEKIGLSSTDLNKAMREGDLPGAFDMLKSHLVKTFGPDALGDLKSYMQVLEEQGPEAADAMADASAGASQVISHAFGGGRSGAAIMSILDNMDRFHMRLNDISRISSSFGERVAQTMDTAAFKFKVLGGEISKIAVILGGVLMPVVMPMIDAVTDFVMGISDWIEHNEALVRTWAPIITMALVATGLFLVLAGAVLILTGLFAAMAFFGPALAVGLAPAIAIVGGVAIAIGLVAGVILVLHNYWKEFQGFWDSRVLPAWKNLMDQMGPTWDALQKAAVWILPTLKAAFDDLVDRVSQKGGMWDDLTNGLAKLLTATKEFLKSRDFANFLAFMAVAVPGAIQLSIDAFLMFSESGIAAIKSLVAFWTIALDVADGRWGDFRKDVGNLKDVTDSWGRAKDDFNKFGKDFDQVQSNMVTSYDKMSNDIFNITNGIVTDTDAKFEQLPEKVQYHLLATQAAAKAGGHGVGTALGDGIASGIDYAVSEIKDAAVRAIVAAKLAANQAAITESPSKLFARDVGRPIGQGIALGIDQSTEPVTSITNLINNTAVVASNQSRRGVTAMPGGSNPQPSSNGDDQAQTYNFHFEIPVCLNEAEIGRISARETVKVLGGIMTS